MKPKQEFTRWRDDILSINGDLRAAIEVFDGAPKAQQRLAQRDAHRGLQVERAAPPEAVVRLGAQVHDDGARRAGAGHLVARIGHTLSVKSTKLRINQQ